jgi:ABC-type polysaccharide/polyol phosphate transport system ATPase subunit
MGFQMSSDFTIQAFSLSKRFCIYKTPQDRLKQFAKSLAPGILRSQIPDYFREFWALRDISFELKKGESLGIVGRNGSGKSTLLQLITGTLTQSSGSVKVNGKVAALLELGSGFNPEFTGRENVFLNAALHGMSQNETIAKLDDIASFADIGQFLDQPVKTYSSGMYARLAFAAAIHTDPDILIVDEILAVGDSPFQQKCLSRIYKMLDNGVAVLMVSHDAYQVRSVCQKALFLAKGNQVRFGTADSVMDSYIASLTQTTPEQTSDSSAPAASENLPNPTLLPDSSQQAFAFSITQPCLSRGNLKHISEISSGDSVTLSFMYETQGVYVGQISFVVNLYRDDDTYIFGTTTAMQGLSPYFPDRKARVEVRFPNLPLLSGQYKWRVAINDGRGLGIFCEAVPVCPFKVVDDFKAVGIVDIAHVWITEAETK